MKPTLLANYDYHGTYQFLSIKGTLFASFQGYDKTIMPLANNYFSPLNPIFGICIDDLRVLSPVKVITLRDGFLGILAFFSRFPIPPKDFSLLIGIPYIFAKIIPVSWARNCFFYDFHPHQEAKCSKLIFTNFPFEDYGINQDLHRERVENIFHANIIDEIQVLTVFKNKLFTQEEGDLNNLDSLGGRQYSTLGLNNFLFSSNFSNTKVYFNLEPFAVFDHYLLQYALFQGASVDGVTGLSSVDEFIQLSPSHSVRISFKMPSNMGSVFSECYKIWRRYEDSFFKKYSDLTPYRELYKNHFIV